MSKKSIARQKKRSAALSSTKPCACGSATKQGFRNDHATGETIAFVKCTSCPMKAEKSAEKTSIDSAGAPDSEWVLIEVITAWNTRTAPKVKPLVWVEHEGGFEAEDFRIYNLENERREIWRLLQADFHTQYRGDFGGKSGLEEARKTAQIIHSRRFISALDTGEAS